MEMVISSEFHDAIVEAIGPYKVLKSLRDSSARTKVYRLEANNKFYYAKLFKRRARFEPEIFAYKTWNRKLKNFTPELITILDNNDEEFGFIMSEISGTIFRETEMTKEEEYKNYEKAGELIRVLQDSFEGNYFGRPSIQGNPIEDSHTDVIEHLNDSINEIVIGLSELDLLNETNKYLINWAKKNITIFESEVPVPVSWDSTPGNWLVNSNKELSGMIDFENMRWGVRVDSFGILYERYFMDDMNREKAFFKGYGSDFKNSNVEKIHFILIKMALADILYGTKYNNDRSLKMGHRLISWLKENLVDNK